jgi:type III secretion protein V
MSELPQIPLRLELHRDWIAGLPESARILDAIKDSLTHQADALIASLGVPGRPVTSVTVDATATLKDRPFRLFANESMCRYPDELLYWAYRYVSATLDSAEDVPFVKAAATRDALVARGLDSLAVFIVAACVEVLKHKPSALLSLPQANAYAAALAPLVGAPPPPATWLITVLQSVLDLRLSIGDREVVARALAENQGDAHADIAERLIAALRTEDIGIHVSPDLMKAITKGERMFSAEEMKFLREGLASELGLLYPPFKLVVDSTLKARSFAFRVGVLTTTPILALKADECLVNDTAQRLTIYARPIASRAVINYASGQPGAIISAANRQEAENNGLTCWDPSGHLILCLATVLRSYGRCYVDTTATEQLLQRGLRSPMLADAVIDRCSIQEVTLLIRALVDEQVPIRNLDLVLSCVLEYAEMNQPAPGTVEDAGSASAADKWRLTCDPSALLPRVRRRMQLALRQKLSRGTDTVVAYLLDPKIEELLTHELKTLPADEEIDRILSAVRTELTHLPPTASRPVILTNSRCRALVRAVVAMEFPRLLVAAHGELPLDTNVQPVARISAG